MLHTAEVVELQEVLSNVGMHRAPACEVRR